MIIKYLINLNIKKKYRIKILKNVNNLNDNKSEKSNFQRIARIITGSKHKRL